MFCTCFPFGGKEEGKRMRLEERKEKTKKTEKTEKPGFQHVPKQIDGT